MPQGPRWTQYQEDSYRLPEGFKRIGYDSDTKRYTFQDKNGVVYQGEPGLDYGTLTPVPPSHSSMESSRPSAFAATVPKRSSTLPTPEGRAPTTFHDILPPELITTSSLSESSQTSPKLPRDKFVEAVRRSALPKMQGVVSNLRRSVTRCESHAQELTPPAPIIIAHMRILEDFYATVLLRQWAWIDRLPWLLLAQICPGAL
ncbi:hypothetical protein BDZ97DRAFT_1918703 [Flammula alnicola]|nr:hypothetical protein BDZ97DRAFT_1918703 [Flammula alnicola]